MPKPQAAPPPERRIFLDVGGMTCPQKGARAVLEALEKGIQEAGLEGKVQVIPRGCFGLCNLAPNLYIEPDGIWYSRFNVRDVPSIVKQHLLKNQPVERLIHYPDRRGGRRPKGGGLMTETAVAKEIQTGDVAPDFTMKNEEGQEVTLSSFRGKKNVVLAFYPFDWSPVCTKENNALTADQAKFSSKESEVFGVSCDSFFSHKAWKEKLGLKHSLLSDQNREVSKKYGLYLDELNCSKRATVVVDRSGKVIFKKVQEIKVPRNNEEIFAAIL